MNKRKKLNEKWQHYWRHGIKPEHIYAIQMIALEPFLGEKIKDG